MDNALNKLHEEYELLSGKSLDQLSDDQITSLRYYLVATQDLDQPLRVRRWVDNAARLERFVADNLRMPRENSRRRIDISRGERSLADWVRYQRQIEEKLCAYQARRLELVQGFHWDPLTSRHEIALARYENFVATEMREPRMASANDSERHIAQWVSRMRRKNAAGSLGRAQISLLEESAYWQWDR